MTNGGKRKGAGRPKGSQSEATTLLKSKSKELMLLAIKKAKTNDTILNKLIDKIAPTLQHTQIEAEIYNELSSLETNELQKRIDEIEGRLIKTKT